MTDLTAILRHRHQRRVAGGCDLGRPIDALMAGAGLELTRVEHEHLPGPRPLGYLSIVVATKA